MLLCIAGTAQAQPATDQAAEGKIAEACAAFDDSQRLDPSPATVMNQANCRERNGQLATARALFLEAARQTSAMRDAKWKKTHATASEPGRCSGSSPTASATRPTRCAQIRTSGAHTSIVDPALTRR